MGYIELSVAEISNSLLAMLAGYDSKDGNVVHHFGPERNISTGKFGADINGGKRMNPNEFNDLLALAPPGGQSFHISTHARWSDKKCGISIHGCLIMCHNDFDLLTFTFMALS